MNPLVELTTEALALTLVLSLPALAVSVVVGLIFAVLQAVTQVQEQTLSFLPKLFAVGLVLVLAGPTLGAELARFTEQLFLAIPAIVR